MLDFPHAARARQIRGRLSNPRLGIERQHMVDLDRSGALGQPPTARPLPRKKTAADLAGERCAERKRGPRGTRLDPRYELSRQVAGTSCWLIGKVAAASVW